MLAIPTLLLCAMIISSKFRPRPHGEDPNKVFAAWNSQNFVPIATSSAFRSKVDECVTSHVSKGWLDDIQVSALRDSLCSALLAFNTGNYSNYEAFRFPVDNGAFDIKRIAELYKGLKGYDPNVSEYHLDPRDDNFNREVLRRFWIFATRTNAFCGSCWREASFESFRLFPNPTNALPPELMSVIRTNKNIGRNVWNPLFTFSPSPEVVLQTKGKLFSLTCSCDIRSSTGPTYPVYFQLYWVDDYQKWLPSAFGGGYSGFSKGLFLF